MFKGKVYLRILQRSSETKSEPVHRQWRRFAAHQADDCGFRSARRALEEWGHSASRITHLIVATSNGVRMPGADLSIARILGLKSNQLGCSAGGTALRIAKEFAENGGIGTRVLVVCSEVAAFTFRPPNEHHVDRLVSSAVMGDGAAAFVVGCKTQGNSLQFDSCSEGIFEIHWAGQFFIPETEEDLTAELTEHGLVYFLSKHVPALVSDSVHELLPEALSHAKTRRRSASLNSNDIFWAVHPGGRAILDKIEQKLELNKEQLCATRETLASYGNMSSATVLFVLDRIRQRSREMGSSTTGEGREWGILLSFGPGLTVEMQLLRSIICLFWMPVRLPLPVITEVLHTQQRRNVFSKLTYSFELVLELNHVIRVGGSEEEIWVFTLLDDFLLDSSTSTPQRTNISLKQSGTPRLQLHTWLVGHCSF